MLYVFKWSKVFNFALVTIFLYQTYPTFAAKKGFDGLIDGELSDVPASTPARGTLSTIPQDIILEIFSYLSVPELYKIAEVCKDLQNISNNETFWELYLKRIYGTFPAEVEKVKIKDEPQQLRRSARKKQKICEGPTSKSSKEKVKIFFLRVKANAETDPERTEKLIEKYNLNLGYHNPYINLVPDILEHCHKLVTATTSEIEVVKHDLIENLARQGHHNALLRKKNALNKGLDGYTKARIKVSHKMLLDYKTFTYETNGQFFSTSRSNMSNTQHQKSPSLMVKTLTDDPLATLKKLDIEWGGKNGLIFDELTKMICEKQDIQALNSYIEELVKDGIYVGYYLKSLGLKFGIFGYDKNQEDAKKYILENYVSY